MRRLFGERIKEFVLTMDQMDDAIFERLMGVVVDYLKKEFDVESVTILIAGMATNGPVVLHEDYTSLGEYPPVVVSDPPGTPVELAFARNTGVWVVGSGEGPLSTSTTLSDRWPLVGEGPEVQQPNAGDEVSTLVVHPIRSAGSEGAPIGVLELTSNSFHEPNPASREEIRTLADAVGSAVVMRRSSERLKQYTNEALTSLADSLERDNWARLEFPKVFVAFAGFDDQDQLGQRVVVDTIESVVREYEQLSIVRWDNMHESGSIMDQVADRIRRASVGICYLSEPNPDKITDSEAPGFVDNPNVLYEAGMMQALFKSQGALMSGWIPVREADSVSRPFDIAQERTITVPRDQSGDVDAAALKALVKHRMDEIYTRIKREV